MRPILLLLALTACATPTSFSPDEATDDSPTGDTDDAPGGSGKDDTEDTPDTDGSGADSDPVVVDPVPDIDTIALSGTRLKRRIVTGSDGSETFLGWWDVTEQVTCAFAAASDGSLRCLPVTDPVSPDAVVYATAYFSDAGCSQAVYMVTCTSPPEWLVTWETQPSCGSRQVVLERGAAYTGKVYARSGASCLQVYETSTLSGYAFYRGTTVSPSRFVQGTVSLD